jgi:hypothetical protein
MVRPRKRWGTVYGFSVVDAGGNWLRFSKMGDSEDEVEEAEPGLARQLDVAARLADSHGDDAGALATLERAIARYPDAAPPERVRALLYRAELQVRLGDAGGARGSFDEALAIRLGDEERAELAAEIDHVADLVGR